ncbi:MAG: alpha/beta fold hydrolase [Shinella sp.]|nr:alpha/beta fold hydrolase [Shinella sp.]
MQTLRNQQTRNLPSGTEKNAAETWRAGSAAIPVSFARTVGLFTPSASGGPRVAALFLSAWGFEEMCTRKTWRILAERLAAAGIPSLRFDYPGTGDSLDGPDLADGLAAWERSILAAASELRLLSGAERLILVGHGLGAALAAQMAGRLDGVEAVALMAPVVSGRFHLRELSAWSKMVDESLGLAEAHCITGKTAVAGLVMPDSVAADVRTLALDTLAASPAKRLLLVQREGREKEAALAAHLESLGSDVTRLPYRGYDDLVSNPTIARQPAEVLDGVVAWAEAVARNLEGTAAPEPPLSAPALLDSDCFVEEPQRFGSGDRLFGIVCRPRAARRGGTVLLLGTAYDRCAGWGRSAVETARFLAANGVASLRFDAANVGDSPPVEGRAEQVQYSNEQMADVSEALDLLDRLDLAPAVLVGRCSGAWLAFRAAVADIRCRTAIAVNPYTFVWDPAISVEDALRYNPRSLGDYRERLSRPETFRRLLAGEIDLRRAAGSIAARLGERAARGVPRLFDPLSRQGRLRSAVHADFRKLSVRRMPLSLIYSENDVGLERYGFFFGAQGQGIAAYPNVRVEIIAGADHNISPQPAQALLRERILAAALAAAAG